MRSLVLIGPLSAVALISEADLRPYVVMLALVHLIPYQDTLDLIARLYLLRLHTAGSSARERCARSIPTSDGELTPYDVQMNLRPYAIVVSVHNVSGQLDRFLRSFSAYRDRLWFVDDASTDDTVAYLQREGVHVRCLDRNSKKPAAIRALVGELSSDIATVVVVDPDIELVETSESSRDLDRAVFVFQKSGMAAACPRIDVARGPSAIELYQSAEYELAFSLGRKSLADCSVTSGVAVYRRDALERALGEHTLSVYAEDLENTFLLLNRGERIYYDGELTVTARCPDRWSTWFSQRVGWSYGLIRVYAERWRELWRSRRRSVVFYYQYVYYLGVLSILIQPVRLASALLLTVSLFNGLDNLFGVHVIPDTAWTSPVYFALAYLQYTLLITAAIWISVDRGRRLRHLAVVPTYLVYALLLTVPTSVGYLNWLALRFTGRRVYRDHYDDVALDRRAPAKLVGDSA